MDLFTLYLITILDGLNGIFRVGLFVGLAAVPTIVLTDLVINERVPNYFKRYLRTYVVSMVVVGLLSAVTPTTNQAFMIMGGYYVTNIDDIEKLPPNVIKAANGFIENYLNEEEDE